MASLTSEHLEARRIRQVQSDVHDRRRGHIAERCRKKDERIQSDRRL